MKQIENGLHGYYNTASTTNGNYMEVDEDHHRIAQTSHKTPFAKVSFVNEASPAEYCVFTPDFNFFCEINIFF